MAFPHSHKTVFVLDHGPYFAMPCHQVEFDVARRGGPGFIPLAAISKSVWTCAVEAVAEYCRIVWDIFPNQDRLLRVVVASPECNEVQPLLGWGEEGQTSAAVMSSLAVVGRPTGDSRSDSPRLEALLGGIAQGLEALCEPSPIQVTIQTSACCFVKCKMHLKVLSRRFIQERGRVGWSTEADSWFSPPFR